ncbi:MraY family glycosyltransferase [Zhongshania aquimaris]|uniref:Undecaprenyl/decaprenyl-phosphate alpha-N-acetylglucosaminyl 1-phosphate transferase n=1 Tax=Zhongshania aquimaris TaxID=2857107 RepID=A0ABS6VN27_9GAMM|nr:MraY family glycosyltransferase [Zhongshania aquimaris]MBW2939718.1 undecaprenyl/decaprenyl-phosphate alpha-N-acetylglucosaminyl 1-phosphate transferase [Zhongshania aquimaris]
MTEIVLVAFSLCFGSLFLLIKFAPLIGLLDHPGGRKQHTKPTPLVGGLAIQIGMLALLLVPSFWDSSYFWLPIISSVVVALGLFDDRFGIDYRVRFIAHMLAGLMMALVAGNVLSSLGDLLGLGVVYLGLMGLGATMFAVASGINALNLIDGLDGLASGMVFIPMLIMCFLSAEAGLEIQALVTAVISASLFAFMLFNSRFPWNSKARIFLGDAGSGALGFAVVWIMIDLAQSGVIHPITALYLLGIPLFDTAGVIVRRRLAGRSPALAGRDHMHHILKDAGMSTNSVAFVLQLSTLLFALLGVKLVQSNLPEWVAFVIYLGFLCSYLWITRSADQLSVKVEKLLSLSTRYARKSA